MDLRTLWRRLIKRPLVLVIILVLSALAGYAGWSATEGEAESKGAIVVVPPWFVESEVFPNPVLNLTERTTNLASALVIALQRRDVGSFVLAEGATDYSMSNLGDNL